jgi:hypothetical protein
VSTALSVKIAAFCRELGESTLSDAAREQDMQSVLERVEQALRAGTIGPGLESDLDALDAMMRRIDIHGQGLYPPSVRTYLPPPPMRGTENGAQWWICPDSRCAGRGRVKPGQDPPVCGVAGKTLAPGPFPR